MDPGNRIAADETNTNVMGSYGRQRVVTFPVDGVSITGLFLSPGVGATERETIRRARIRYVVVDRRIAGVVPLKGFFYEKWEKEIVDYGRVVDASTLSRFDALQGVSRVYDSGNIQIYDVSGLSE